MPQQPTKMSSDESDFPQNEVSLQSGEADISTGPDSKEAAKHSSKHTENTPKKIPASQRLCGFKRPRDRDGKKLTSPWFSEFGFVKQNNKAIKKEFFRSSVMNSYKNVIL